MQASDAAFYYHNDSNSKPVRQKWIGIDSTSLHQPIRSAAEPRLTCDPTAIRTEIKKGLNNNCVSLSGKTLVTTDHWLAGNMCHGLFDHLYRHWLATNIGLRVDHCLIIGETWDWVRFVAEEILNITNIVYIKPGVAYQCQELYFWSNSFPAESLFSANERALRHPANRADLEYLSYLRKKITTFSKNEYHHECKAHSAPLFISRPEGAHRNFTNLKSIEAYFKLNGFDIQYMENHNPQNQLKLMQNRSHIAGLHGAGLTNLVAADKKANILEIFSEKGTNAYAKVMNALGNPYQTLDNRQAKNPLLLDILLLEDNLKNYLGGSHKKLPRLLFNIQDKTLRNELKRRLRRAGYRARSQKNNTMLAMVRFPDNKLTTHHVIFVYGKYSFQQMLLRILGIILRAVFLRAKLADCTFMQWASRLTERNVLTKLRKAGYNL